MVESNQSDPWEPTLELQKLYFKHTTFGCLLYYGNFFQMVGSNNAQKVVKKTVAIPNISKAPLKQNWQRHTADRCSPELTLSDLAYLPSVQEVACLQGHYWTAPHAVWYFISYCQHDESRVETGADVCIVPLREEP